MMNTTNILIGMIGTIIGAILGILGFFNNWNKKVLNDGRMLEKFDHLQNTVNSIDKKVDQKNDIMDSILRSQNDMIIRHDTKLAEHDKEIESIKTKLDKV